MNYSPYFLRIITLLFITMLNACHSLPVFNSQELTAYLNQFIGKNRETVLQSINFQKLGFITSSRAQSLQSEAQIVYSALRPINLAVSIPMNTSEHISKMEPSTNNQPDSNQHTQINATCTIIFHLKNNLVTQWEKSGQAC